MVIPFEIISIYKSVTMIKRVYKIGEYFLRPHTISVSLAKSSHGISSASVARGGSHVTGIPGLVRWICNRYIVCLEQKSKQIV